MIGSCHEYLIAKLDIFGFLNCVVLGGHFKRSQLRGTKFHGPYQDSMGFTIPWVFSGLPGKQLTSRFGCKWLPWESPARAPLATFVALSRAFMPVSIPRIRVKLCSSAYSYTDLQQTPFGLASVARERRARRKGP